MSLTSQAPARDRLLRTTSVEEALAAMSMGAQPFAGGSWLMRAPTRGEVLRGDFVALTPIDGLNRIEIGAQRVVIGAAATLAMMAEAFADIAEFAGLATAAGKAGNPALRRMATCGGNLCTPAFAAADLPPALLALEAEVLLQSLSGSIAMPMAQFMARRVGLLRDYLVIEVRIARQDRCSAHTRLPMRKAGDYAAAMVSLCLTEGGARVAVGAVEDQARRWPALEAALDAMPEVTPAAAEVAAKTVLGGFAPRDGLDAPGWYRVEVLPALVRRAVAAALLSKEGA